MRARMFMEVEISDEVLLAQFGEALPELTAQGEIEKGFARSVTQILRRLPGVVEAETCVVPTLIGPGSATNTRKLIT